MLEREDELGRIDALLDAMPAGRGGVLIAEGEAGIGKSALLEAGARKAEERGFQVLAARGGELEREFGYGVVRQLLEPRLGRASATELEALLSGAAHLARPILSEGEPDTQGMGGVPDPAFAAQHGLYWLVDNLAGQGTVLLVVDDAHWADLASLRFLVFLARRLDGVAAGVLIGWRVGEPGSPTELLETLRAEPLVEMLAPAALSRAATERLVRAEVSEATDDRFCRACHATTGGNPFLLSELTTAVAQGQLEPTAEATERVRVLGPTAISRSVFVRLARLPRDASALARAVAVLDVDSDVRHAAQLADLPLEATLTAAGQLAEARILSFDRPLRFIHPILRGAVYGDLGAAEQARLHTKAARILDEDGATDRAAAHLLVTEPVGDEWVARCLARAGERAIVNGAADTALALLERAFAEPPPPAELARVLYLLGSAEQLTGNSSATEHLSAAMETGAEPELRWEAARRLARQLNILQRSQEAIDVLESVLEEQRQRDPPRALATEAEMGIFGLFPDSVAPSSRARLERVTAGLSGDSIPERMLLVAEALGRALGMHGTADETADLVERALSGARDRFLTLLPVTSTAFWACGALVFSGRLTEARRLSEEAMDHARRTGGAFWVSAAASWRALAAFWLGDLRDAEAHAHDVLDAAPGRFPLAQIGIVGFLADLLRLRGELDAADATLAAYGFSTDQPPGFALATYLLQARAAVRVEQGRYEDARRDAEAILAAERERGGLIPGMLPTAALSLNAAGDRNAALDVARRNLEIADRWGVPGHRGAAFRTLGVLEGGTAGLDLLRCSCEVLEGSPYRFELASSLVEHGAALRRGNQRQAARAPLARGMDLAHRCGAAALALRAQEELRATGARPRHLLRSGVDALTPSERRVAQMAASGMSNRDIAQALFVTTKTVETHLRHVFQKLDVTARVQLDSALRDKQSTAPPAAGPIAEPDVQGTWPILERPVVTTVLFTDIVDSTRRQAQLGGRRWRDLHARYEELVRDELARFGGQEIKTLGDGFLATFGSATAAIRCAKALGARCVASLGLSLRTGIHTGEVEFTDGDIRGLAVTIAARISGLAAANEVLCSGTVADLTVGTELEFDEGEATELKGLPGKWRVCSVI